MCFFQDALALSLLNQVDVAGLDKGARLKDEMQSPLFILLAVSGRIAAT